MGCGEGWRRGELVQGAREKAALGAGRVLQPPYSRH